MTGSLVCIKMTVRCPNCKALATYYMVPQQGGMIAYSLNCDYCGHSLQFRKPLYPIHKPNIYPQAILG